MKKSKNNHRTTISNRMLNVGMIATLVPHLFCCVLPVVVAVVGLTAPGAAHWHIVPHAWEPWLFVLSGVMLAVSWALTLRDCACGCTRCEAPRKHRTQKIILWIITGLFFASLSLYFFGHSPVH